MRLEISGRAIVGSKEPQQDSWRVFNARGEDVSQKAQSSAVVAGDGTLVVVADGIGGYAGGEIASRLACDAFGRAFFGQDGPVPDRLLRALAVANAAIAEEKGRSPDLQEMGCTLVAVHFQQNSMTFVSVGDSLLLRSRDDEIHRVNVDHSYFDYLDRQVLGSGDPSRWAIAIGDTRRRASLTLAVTGGDLNSGEYGHKPQIATRPLEPDDVVIIASDGIETLDWVQLQNFLKHLRPTGIMGVADGLIGAVDGIGKNRSYQDNTTILVVGASSGAGLTRVAMPVGQAATDAAPGGGSEFASRFAWLPLLSNTRLLFGAIIVGVALIVALLLLPPRGSNNVTVTPQDQPAVANDKPQPKKKQSALPTPIHSDVDQTQQAAATPQPATPATTPAQGSAPPPLADQTASPSAEAQTQVPAPASQVQRPPPGLDRDAPKIDPNAPRNEVRPRFSNARWRDGTKLPQASPILEDGLCRAACNENMSCVAYTWRGDVQARDRRCELFSSVGVLVASQFSQSGLREWDNFAWKGDPGQSTASDNPINCATTCSQSTGCGGYTFRTGGRCEIYPPTNAEPVPQIGASSGKLRLLEGARRPPGD